MHAKFAICFLALAGVCSSSPASDTVFDRSAEISRLAESFKSGTRGAVIDASRELFDLGISDESLAAVIATRLTADVGSIEARDKVGQQYLEWMAKGLASTGVDAAVKVLDEAAGRANHLGARTFFREEAAKVAWYRGRNAVMANRTLYREGDDPQVVRLLNLVVSDDFSHKLFAADRMNWTRALDPRLIAEANAQVLRYMDTTVTGSSRDQAKTIGMFIKLLGHSGNTNYRDTLQKVLKSRASPQTKKHAKEALGRLRQ